MNLKEWEEYLQIPVQNEEFLSKIFLKVSQSSNKENLNEIFDLSEEILLSFLCDSSNLQDSFCLRSERRAKLAASFLLTEHGDINPDKLKLFILFLKENGYIFYPNGSSDGVLTHHMLNLAEKLRDNLSLSTFFKKFKLPLCHKNAEDLVRASLGLFKEEPLTNFDVQKAVLAACFSYLRQNVGSCFATAPAILIQSEQIEYLLSDLYELLMTGKLKKTIAGMESSVPLSPTSGPGDLYRIINNSFSSSPGLIAAFTASGLLTEEMNLQEKIQKIKEFTAQQNPDMPVKDLIKKTLLTYFSLEESDLLAYEKIELSLVKNQGFGRGALTAHLPPEKIKAAQQFLEKEKKARAAFTAVVDHPLLKTWEFTLASFSESKTDFTNWNFYFSLGFHPEEPGGIGGVIYSLLLKKFDESKQKAEKFQEEYVVAIEALRATETLLKSASTESDIRRLKVEFNSRLHHMQTCLEIRDQAHKEASALSSFFPALLDAYKRKFVEFFQEIYDADMTDIKTEIYEDSPAGFRLVYKHGRSNASLWSLIYNANGFTESLSEFFLSVESYIASECPWDEENKLISDITTALVSHVRSDIFLETAFTRVARAHRETPPKEKTKKKPWSYTSGGSMMTLLQTYYKKESLLTKEEFWAENETNLLVFLLNSLKNMPLSVQDACLSPYKGMLISSPTHAFILYPGLEFIQKGWEENIFTYSWVRDQVINPGQEFYNGKKLTLPMQTYLIEEIGKKLPSSLQGKLKNCLSQDTVTTLFFRENLANILPADLVDSFLYEKLPLIPSVNWKQSVRFLLQDLECKNISSLLESFPDTPSSIMSAKIIKNLAKAFYLLDKNSLCFSFDLHKYIEKKAQKIGLSPPSTFIFADTNWMGYYFGFVVNPGTNLLELWKLDYTGSSGSKMSQWQRFLNGTDQSPWNVYTHLSEYT